MKLSCKAKETKVLFRPKQDEATQCQQTCTWREEKDPGWKPGSPQKTKSTGNGGYKNFIFILKRSGLGQWGAVL